MRYLLSLCIFFLGIYSFIGLRSIHISALLSIFLWYSIERLCIITPEQNFFIIVTFIVLLFPVFVKFFNKSINIIYITYILLISTYCGEIAAYTVRFSKVGAEQFLAILQSNTREIFENAGTFVGWQGIVFPLLFMFLLLSPFLAKRQIQLAEKLISRKKFIKYLLLLPVCYAIFGFCQSIHNGLPAHFFYYVYDEQKTLISKLKNRNITDTITAIDKQKGLENLIIIFIIGESANSDHMGAYGYFRNTTPWLSETVKNNETILFKNAFSMHSYTDICVPYMISCLNQCKPGSIYTQPTIINKLSHKGYTTLWLSNQEKTNYYTNTITTLALESDHTIFLKTASFHNKDKKTNDTNLLPFIKSALDQANGSHFIVIHLMGSHAEYINRYPENFNSNLGDIKLGLWGDRANINKIDAYDKSISYTDNFISSIIDILPDNRNIAIIYASDHGENVINGLQHNSSFALYDDMFKIPVFVWFSKEYKKNAPNVVEWLKSESEKYFTNDNIYELIKCIESKKCKKITHDTADCVLLRQGKNTVNDLLYNRIKYRLAKLSHMTGKNLLLHRANSLQKLAFAMQSGFDGVEIDVIYNSSNKILEVGHDKNHMSGLSIEKYLDFISTWDYKKIWIDLKNLSAANENEIFYLLNKLDERFDIKRRAIIETGNIDFYFGKHASEGWFMSYYVPSFFKNNDSFICNKINYVREKYSLSGLSFEFETYKHVYESCPSAFKNIMLNTWVLNSGVLNDNNSLEENLLKEDLIGNEHLDSILLPMNTGAEL